VHWALHRMGASRSALLRALAWPHAVHHRWIDRDLETHLDLRLANVFCHIVPEYLTQLVFTGVVALVLPLSFAAVLALLQTGIFLGILSARGQDINHRPPARVDAHPPGWLTPPAYHLRHHAWPDAHFSAYTKIVDWLVGGGAQIAGRRFAWQGAESALGAALRTAVERAGGLAASEAEPGGVPDVLVLLDAHAPLAGPVESFITATRDRRLPPEVWALRSDASDATARHYLRDVRVVFRTLLAPTPPPDAAAAARAARRALFWIRRDAHFVPLGKWIDIPARRRFRATAPVAPAGAQRVRHRLEWASR